MESKSENEKHFKVILAGVDSPHPDYTLSHSDSRSINESSQRYLQDYFDHWKLKSFSVLSEEIRTNKRIVLTRF